MANDKGGAFRERAVPDLNKQIQQGTPFGGVPAETSNEVQAMYGISMGKMPIRGKTVAEARAMLAPMWNIPDDAVATISGEIVADDTVIDENVAMVNFVKQAAVKGATVSIEHNKVRAVDGMSSKECSIADLVKGIQFRGIKGLTDEPLPPRSKWVVEYGSLTVVICELDPQVRRLRVAREGRGPSAHYEEMVLATPFVVLKLPFWHGGILDTCELFYRNSPLTSINDKLYRSNLLNISPNARRCDDWVCTQYLRHVMEQERTNRTSINAQCDAAVRHIFDSGFNRSSDQAEGMSAFKFCQENLNDTRVTDFDNWKAETAKDPAFILGVKWFDIGATVRSVIDKQFRQFKQQPLASADDISAMM